MADVRSLLRNERAQRRINHPQATYTATGTLECSVCHIPLKSDHEVWNKHLKSTQHAMRAERLRLNTARRPEPSREVSAGSKKRKADSEEDDSRKKARPKVDVPGSSFDETRNGNNASEAVIEPSAAPEPPEDKTPDKTSTTLASHPAPTPSTVPAVDEDEWAAFERDIATPPPDPSLPSALRAEATISAAPLTAAEIAAQSREQASQQTKERREEEVEAEKEDAARALEEEFDEMEGLEERVARLRRKREELRVRKKVVEEAEAEAEGEGGEVDNGGSVGNEDAGEDSDEEDEDPYGWGSLGR